MIEDTIEVLKTLSVFIASNRKYIQERKFPEKFSPLQENLLMRLQNATKSVDKLFESLNRIHDISSLDS